MADPNLPPERDGSWRWTVFVVVVLALVAAGGFAAIRLSDFGDDAKEIDFPDKWDKRVRPYVRIVERERDLDFRHPIEVEFLSDEEFREEVTADEDDLTDEEREEIKQFTGLMRAVGLVEGELDLFEAQNQLSGSAILGRYSSEDKQIRIRGKKLTLAVEVVLVHELTHALQDQHFDLQRRSEELEQADDSEGEAAFRALVEGDAQRIEEVYVEELGKRGRAAYQREQRKQSKGLDKGSDDVPEVLKTMMGAPYALGSALLNLAIELDGNDEVDDLFRDPPASTENLLDPWTVLEDEDVPVEVEEPALGEGEDEFDSDIFGGLGWYLVLAERIPLIDALDAADGWAGDSYVAFERDNVSCFRANIAADSRADFIELRDALEAWVAALPGATASVDAEGDLATFESCDPGVDAARVGKDVSAKALRLALARTYVAANVIGAGADDDWARCFADKYVHEFRPEQVFDPEFGKDDPAVQSRFREMGLGCR